MTAAQRFVPYAFARDHLILLRPLGEREAEVWIGESTSMAALNEAEQRGIGERLQRWGLLAGIAQLKL